ncbi:hypothetical protein DESA109040_09200 [Deinococcus saxicola]|uniref:hypothetical protein n=1 Tax=Deinococcus saxicola TaxID=249406 RepID=UPI0039EE95E7
MKTLGLLGLTLYAGALADGAEPLKPLTRTEVLKRIPDVRNVREYMPPFSLSATHRLRMHVGFSTTEVLGSLGAGDGAGRVNSVLLWIDTPQATTLQKQAVTAVARGVLARCMIDTDSD